MAFSADPDLVDGCPVLLRDTEIVNTVFKEESRATGTHVGMGLSPGQYFSLCLGVEKNTPARIELFDGDHLPDNKLVPFSLRKGRDVRKLSAAIGVSNFQGTHVRLARHCVGSGKLRRLEKGGGRGGK